MTWKENASRLLADQKFRFLIAGGFNTGVGFLVFVLLDLSVGRALDRDLHSVVASVVVLLLAHVLSSIVAFFVYRRFVFDVSGHALLDFIRFEGVYVVPLAINLVVLPILVELGIPRILAQGSIIVVTTIFSYLGHRHFSFRRKATSVEAGAMPDTHNALTTLFSRDRRSDAPGAEKIGETHP